MPHGPSKRPVRVLVVDDHADVRFLVRAILGDAGPDVTYAGEAAGASEALDALERTDPDVVVLDARMPGVDGFETAALLLRAPARAADPAVLGARRRRDPAARAQEAGDRRVRVAGGLTSTAGPDPRARRALIHALDHR